MLCVQQQAGDPCFCSSSEQFFTAMAQQNQSSSQAWTEELSVTFHIHRTGADSQAEGGNPVMLLRQEKMKLSKYTTYWRVAVLLTPCTEPIWAEHLFWSPTHPLLHTIHKAHIATWRYLHRSLLFLISDAKLISSPLKIRKVAKASTPRNSWLARNVWSLSPALRHPALRHPSPVLWTGNSGELNFFPLIDWSPSLSCHSSPAPSGSVYRAQMKTWHALWITRVLQKLPLGIFLLILLTPIQMLYTVGVTQLDLYS